MGASLSSLVDNLVGTNTGGIKCCDSGVELVEIDCKYESRFECGKYGNIKTRKLDQQALEVRFSNLRRRCMSDYERVFIRMNIWIVSRGLKRWVYLQRRRFLAI